MPLIDPVSGQTVPLPGYNPNRFFGIDALRLDPDWYHLEGFILKAIVATLPVTIITTERTEVGHLPVL